MNIFLLTSENTKTNIYSGLILTFDLKNSKCVNIRKCCNHHTQILHFLDPYFPNNMFPLIFSLVKLYQYFFKT